MGHRKNVELFNSETAKTVQLNYQSRLRCDGDEESCRRFCDNCFYIGRNLAKLLRSKNNFFAKSSGYCQIYRQTTPMSSIFKNRLFSTKTSTQKIQFLDYVQYVIFHIITVNGLQRNN